MANILCQSNMLSKRQVHNIVKIFLMQQIIVATFRPGLSTHNFILHILLQV